MDRDPPRHSISPVFHFLGKLKKVSPEAKNTESYGPITSQEFPFQNYKVKPNSLKKDYYFYKVIPL